MALGIAIGYAIKKFLDGDYDYQAEIYDKAYTDGYKVGYNDGEDGIPRRK
jgi:hypothetical protein